MLCLTHLPNEKKTGFYLAIIHIILIMFVTIVISYVQVL